MSNTNNFSTIDHVIQLHDGKEMRVWETQAKGSKTRNNTIVIASGFARRMDHFAGLVEYLSNNGFHIFRYDSLNHVGLSSGNVDEFSMTSGKDSLLSVFEWLRIRGIKNIGLIATSLSARIAYEVVDTLNLSFFISVVGVVNLKYTLEKAFEHDYLKDKINELPKNIEFEGYRLGAEIFVDDCLKNKWETLDATKIKMKNFNIPFIAFTANNDNWVAQDDVLELISSINSHQKKLYSLIGSAHDLGENLVVLRNFYQSATKASIALDNGSVDIDVDIIEPSFEDLTMVTIRERRLKNEIESLLMQNS